jgi:hypothetical protein
MTGDVADMISRIKAVLPTRWFPDASPVLDSLLCGPATAWSTLYTLLAFVRSQSRLATVSGDFLDGFSADFFGGRLDRRSTETDDQFRLRVAAALVGEHATRTSLEVALTDLTGRVPGIFEPARPADTGAYAGPALGYGVAGAWGNMTMPFQVFVSAYRAPPAGITNVAGYGTGGPLALASLTETAGQVSDLDIYAAITSVMPTASIAWTRITN